MSKSVISLIALTLLGAGSLWPQTLMNGFPDIVKVTDGGTPPSGAVRIWANDSDQIVTTDSLGTDTVLGESGGGATNAEVFFAAQTSVTITAATHGFDHAKLGVVCYDNASPKAQIVPLGVTVDASTFQVVVTFSAAETGSCVVAGGSGSSEPYEESFTTQTSITVTGAEHGFGHARLAVFVYDDADPKALMTPLGVTIDPDAFAVVVTLSVADSGSVVVMGGAGGAPESGAITMTFDGRGADIATGVSNPAVARRSGVVTGATILSYQTCSISIDVWVDSYANHPPTDADSITSAAPITLSSANKNTPALTGWTTAFNAGDEFVFNVDSNTGCENVVVVLETN